ADAIDVKANIVNATVTGSATEENGVAGAPTGTVANAKIANAKAVSATNRTPPPGKAIVPDLSGLAARSAVQKLAERSLEPELRGSGRAVAQSPPPGAIVKRGARVRVTLAPPG